MQRSDNAIEVWHRTDIGDVGRHVGWLIGIDGGDRARREVVLRRDMGEKYDQQCFALVDRNREYTHMETMILRGGEAELREKIRREVAFYAERFQMMERDVTRFTWAVVDVDTPHYEWIFDHPKFEPFDESEPDLSIEEPDFMSRLDAAVKKMEDRLFDVVTGTTTTSAVMDEVASLTEADIEKAMAIVKAYSPSKFKGDFARPLSHLDYVRDDRGYSTSYGDWATKYEKAILPSNPLWKIDGT